ncbi:MAG: beta-N-acetylhexosaminidase [Bacteroidales bacterium]|nr:beta-N-acetylhexosaminidase [Bacteroidales bacterium]
MKTLLSKILLALYVSLMAYATSWASDMPGILPYPNDIKYNQGTLVVGKSLKVYSDPVFAHETQKQMAHIGNTMGIVCKTAKKDKATLHILYNKSIAAEGYSLRVDSRGMEITASTDAGLFYAVKTLEQLIKPNGKKHQCPYVEINDSPAFGWRGFLLDEARNFQGKEEVKKILNEMASLKMNVFHWHLTDDQGWRIEIKKYPRLTEIGGRRDSTQLNWYESTVFDPTPVSGYYTQDDIREIISYAAERHIKIIPEIEFPGHASAAIAAYPWLSCSQEPIKVPCSYGVLSGVFNVVNPKVQEFIHGVLDEVADLFPSDIIHIGGDEVKDDDWKASEEVQSFMKQHQIGSSAELQVWFTNQLADYLSKKGKKIMGWNDITGDKLHAFQSGGEVKSQLNPENAIVQFWVGNPEMCVKALQRGLKIVNSTSEFTYLNYNYDKIVPGLEYAHIPLPLEKSYSFNPIPEYASSYANQVLGLTCAMWGEWIYRPSTMYKMVYPYIASYAETGWTQNENKDYKRFLSALDFFTTKWKSAGYIN